MKIVKFLIESVFELLKVITYKWVFALINIVKRICDIIVKTCNRSKLSHAEKNSTSTKCSVIDHPAFQKPDPLIYCQKYFLKLGLAVTWDNPDIVFRRNGVIVTENILLPNTDYEIDARIWNNSYDAPVVGLKIDFMYLNFGISGAALNPIGSKVINLGVKGGVNHPAHAIVNWRTPPVPVGQYSIQVSFKCVDDLNSENNVGINSIDIVAPQSPAIFTFPLRNETQKQQLYAFEIDTYTLPQRCQYDSKKVPKTNDQKWKVIQNIHNKIDYPIPVGWDVKITPERVSLEPDEIKDIQVKITPPDSFKGKQPFNINAKYGNNFNAGGVTLIVSKK
jgi:hypothetical protein